MNKQIFTTFATLAAMLLTACVPPNSIQRHVAESRFGSEQLTSQTATSSGGGIVIYNKTFPLPDKQNTLFVTLSSTGDTHDGAASWFSALVNGVSCSTGGGGAAGAPPGWVALQKHSNDGGGTKDLHDNGISYTWCCREAVEPGAPNNVQIKMASSKAGDHVFIERSHFYIDSVGAKLCNEVRQPTKEFPASFEKMPEGHRQ